MADAPWPLRLCFFIRTTERHGTGLVSNGMALARHLARLGHEVTVLSSALPGGGAVEGEGDGITVHYLADAPVADGPDRFHKVGALAFDAMQPQQGFHIVLGRAGDCDGFFAHSRFAGQIPAILHQGTYPRWLHQIEMRAGVAAPALAFLLAPFYGIGARKAHASMRRAARVVCVSAPLAAAFRRAAWWKPPRTVAIPYGIDVGPVPPGTGERDSPPRLVSLGRLARNKGSLALAEVLARLRHPSATVQAIGPASPQFRARVLAHAERLGVAPRFTAPGPVPRAEVAARLASAAAFLFPSTHGEGLPKAVLEAMAAGVPVIAYRTKVLESMVDHGVTGLLVPVRSTAAMARAVDDLLANPALAAQMGQAARRKIKAEFRPDMADARWQALLQEVVAETSG